MFRSGARVTPRHPRWVVTLAFAALVCPFGACDGRGRDRPAVSENQDSLLRERARGLSHNVPFRLGLANLADGDEITINGIFGDKPTLSDGGTYCVWGYYKLDSVASSRLGIFIAPPGGFYADDRGPTKSEIRHGEGTFALCLRIDRLSWLTLKFQGTPRGPKPTPVNGINFGAITETSPETHSFTMPYPK